MDIKEKKERLQQLIVLNHFEEAFQQLSLLLPVASAEAGSLVILENAYWTNLRDERLGVATHETIALTRNQLLRGLLELIESLSEEQVVAAQPTDFRSAIAEIRNLLVRQERIPHAFVRLEQLIQPTFEHYMVLLSPLRVDYNTNHTDHVIAGTLERDKYLITLKRIVRGLEELINKLSSEYDRLNGQHFAMGSELAVVSCNRKKIIRQFWQRFEQKAAKGQPIMFYLLGEQKYSQAESLVRRLITNLKEEKPAVKYNGFSQITIPLINFLPGDEVEGCRFELRKTFNRGLRPEVPDLQALMSRIDTDYPQLSRHRFIPWVLKFKMPEHCWDSIGAQTLRWFIEQFCRIEGQFKQCLVFFLIVELEPAKTPKTAKPKSWRRLFGGSSSDGAGEAVDLSQELPAIAEKYPQHTTALPPLSLVEEEDLLDWYRDFEPNERVRELKVAEIISQLPPGNVWFMADVERCLRSIIEQHQKALHDL
ncbi:MAG: hypothetical protein R2828_30025 [Saprospiraceae bacterium]